MTKIHTFSKELVTNLHGVHSFVLTLRDDWKSSFWKIASPGVFCRCGGEIPHRWRGFPEPLLKVCSHKNVNEDK